MKEQSLKVKTSSLPQSRISIELDIPSSSCKTIVEDTIKTISKSVKLYASIPSNPTPYQNHGKNK